MGNNFSQLAIVMIKTTVHYRIFQLGHSVQASVHKNRQGNQLMEIRPLMFYKNQFNFAVYCANTRCIGGWDLLNDTNPYVVALFNVHLFLV